MPSRCVEVLSTTTTHALVYAQMYAAGWAEGWLTAHRIFQQVHNTMHYFKTSLGLKDDKPVDWCDTCTSVDARA